ncbi:MAG TPA: Wzz/FepE/Etk N-terminal domain-containing protein [Candidatus Limnocylindrales bacterium]|nr:Wzz/FepE/Etk N-terminal domain-containing protein [Candidatus Limnocylindrales bacterium]
MEQELDLYAIWQVFVKRWKLIVVVPLFAALTSALISLFIIIPQYSAAATLMVMRPVDAAQILIQDIQVSRQLVHTYREIAHSRRVLEVAIVNGSLPYTVTELREKVDVVSVRDTEIITITVTDADPLVARDVANGVTRAFMEEVVEIMQVENVSIVDAAVEPTTPISPRIPLNVAVALVIGIMTAVGLVFLFEYFDRSFKDPEEITRLLGIPVLGIIPHMEES